MNEFAPVFDALEVNKTVFENSGFRTLIGDYPATDNDVEFNKLFYDIIEGNDAGKFFINAKTGVLRTSASPIDREADETFALVINVEDNGTPPKSANFSVFVVILDVNDNAPVFGESQYNTTVVENVDGAVPSATLMTVTATDADVGINADITFRLSGMDAAAFNIVSVGNEGRISQAALLDYETQTEMNFQVIATDGGDPTLSKSVDVTVFVADRNDNAPKFLRSNVALSLNEDQAINAVLTTMTATDADQNTNITYSIVDGNIDGQFGINITSGALFLTKALDRETRDSYVLSLRASDNQEGTGDAVASVNVTVLDVNDISPVFQNCKAGCLEALSVAENATIGTIVLTVLATDGDLVGTQNAEVRYSISAMTSDNGFPFVFEVNAVTGAVSLARPLDRETKASYSLIILADDQGTPPKQTAVPINVTITVSDINDMAPTFAGATYAVTVAEDAVFNFTVATIAATDGDELGTMNVVLSYTIVSGNEDGKFNLDQQTGRVSVIGVLDRETVAGYVLMVAVSDGGTPTLWDNSTLTITISDINDNGPVFQHLPYDVEVSEFALASTLIVVCNASDADSGANAALTFAITNGNAAGLFEVSSSGYVPSVPVL